MEIKRNYIPPGTEEDAEKHARTVMLAVVAEGRVSGNAMTILRSAGPPELTFAFYEYTVGGGAGGPRNIQSQLGHGQLRLLPPRQDA